MPPGQTSLVLTVLSESGAVGMHSVTVRRALSQINTLERLELIGGRLATAFSSGASVFSVVMEVYICIDLEKDMYIITYIYM